MEEVKAPLHMTLTTTTTSRPPSPSIKENESHFTTKGERTTTIPLEAVLLEELQNVEYIPRFIEKPPKLKTYDETADHDEHVKHINTVLDYHEAWVAVKCKLFVLER
ncbi:hypothetical protein A2U01_0038691, partial [Trifolium medium]|nr:hypothetical protein [Trifolium medium]